jgi:hypothetical protein
MFVRNRCGVTSVSLRITPGCLIRATTAMLEDRKKGWVDLCAEAAICEDAERFQELAHGITTLLNEEQERLDTQPRTIRVMP